jgi:hypothetical protein
LSLGGGHEVVGDLDHRHCGVVHRRGTTRRHQIRPTAPAATRTREATPTAATATEHAAAAATTATATQPWWLGYLETGASDVVFSDVERVMLYADWGYVLIEAGPVQAATWRDDDQWKGRLPDLMFPADRSWLLSTLWDDFWSSLGGPQTLVDAFLRDSNLGNRTRAVSVSTEDATPPGHAAT